MSGALDAHILENIFQVSLKETARRWWDATASCLSTESLRERLKYEPPYHSLPSYHSLIQSDLDTRTQHVEESFLRHMHVMLENVEIAKPVMP